MLSEIYNFPLLTWSSFIPLKRRVNILFLIKWYDLLFLAENIFLVTKFISNINRAFISYIFWGADSEVECIIAVKMTFSVLRPLYYVSYFDLSPVYSAWTSAAFRFWQSNFWPARMASSFIWASEMAILPIILQFF